jgi:23S rRNA pseudouridine2457 synthase
MHHHFIIHKPYGYLSQFITNEKRRKNKKLLGELHDFPEGTMAIGRLDEKSEGLLFLTTNGITSDQVRSKSIEKEYYVQVDGEITQDAINELKKGVEITVKSIKYATLECEASILNSIPIHLGKSENIREERHGPTSWVSITITEGKNRQVRKMTAAVGFPTLRLVRVRIGNIHLNTLKAGEVIETENLLIAD